MTTLATPTLAQAPKPSLKTLAVRGSIWTVGGYGAGQVLRLGSNLILSRLLFPEAFGLMALVAVFMQGLQMFSDVGIGPSIIQNRRGDDPEFLNTAWTMQIIRGVVLWICACIGALPFAMFYGEQQLAWLIPIAGLTALIAGFNSTSLFLANKKLALGRLTVMELADRVIAIGVMIAWALIWPSVWALVAGGIAAACAKLVMSHLWLESPKHRIHWNRTCARELIRFGRWILLSTIIAFGAKNIDRLTLGRLTSMEFLGVYAIAMGLLDAPLKMLGQIGSRVVFPLLAQKENLKAGGAAAGLRRVHGKIVACGTGIALLTGVFGPWFIHTLYDERYAGAAPIIALLSYSLVIEFATGSYSKIFLALGHSGRGCIMAASQLSCKAGFMALGAVLLGEQGLIIGLVAAMWVQYPVMSFAVSRYGAWFPRMDLVAFAGAAVLALIHMTFGMG